MKLECFLGDEGFVSRESWCREASGRVMLWFAGDSGVESGGGEEGGYIIGGGVQAEDRHSPMYAD